MLIIFDLDDTLIDTSGCVTPIKLQLALEDMMRSGLRINDPEEALEILKRLDEAADSARSALKEFLEIMDADEKYFTIGLNQIYDEFSPDIPVYPLDDAIDVLQELSESHKLAIVTVGENKRQLSKMKKAGIDTGIFCKIITSEVKNKKIHYEALMEEFSYIPQETLVCGDRILLDLVPAKELGCKAVHMQWGRGLNSYLVSPSKKEVDFSITKLRQLKEIIATL